MLHHQGGVFLETWELTSNIFTQKVRLKKSIFKIWIFLPNANRELEDLSLGNQMLMREVAMMEVVGEGLQNQQKWRSGRENQPGKYFIKRRKNFFQRKILLEIILVPYFKSRVQERLSHKCAPFLWTSSQGERGGREVKTNLKASRFFLLESNL